MKRLLVAALLVACAGAVTAPAFAGQNDGPGPVINPNPGTGCPTGQQNPQNPPNGKPRTTTMTEATYVRCGKPFGWRSGVDVLNLVMPDDPGSFNRCISTYGGAFYPFQGNAGKCFHIVFP